MSKNSQRLQALRDRGDAMYREGQADGKLGIAYRYLRQDSHFGRYNIGYKHGWDKAGRGRRVTTLQDYLKPTLWQRIKSWFS